MGDCVYESLIGVRSMMSINWGFFIRMVLGKLIEFPFHISDFFSSIFVFFLTKCQMKAEVNMFESVVGHMICTIFFLQRPN